MTVREVMGKLTDIKLSIEYVERICDGSMERDLLIDLLDEYAGMLKNMKVMG